MFESILQSRQTQSDIAAAIRLVQQGCNKIRFSQLKNCSAYRNDTSFKFYVNVFATKTNKNLLFINTSKPINISENQLEVHIL